MPSNRQDNNNIPPRYNDNVTWQTGVSTRSTSNVSAVQPVDIVRFESEELQPMFLRANIDVDIVCEDDKYMPAYANSTDACMDLKVKGTKIISPYSVQTFGTGVKVKIPNGYVMMIYPRSSTGMKLHCALANGTGIIDAGYRDEIKLALYNFGDYSVEIEDGQRVAQFIIIPRPKVSLRLVNDDKYFREGDRGGGIGSTGR